MNGDRISPSLPAPPDPTLFDALGAEQHARACSLTDWPEALPRSLEPRLFAWLHAWQSLPLAEVMRIEISSRMRSSLGRAYLEQRLVRINHLLLAPEQASLLDEVFCHEVAHLVVHERHGRRAAPHGREWRNLLVEVGSPVRVTIPRSECAFLPPEQRRRRRARTRRRPRRSGPRTRPYRSLLDGLWSALNRLHGRLM